MEEADGDQRQTVLAAASGDRLAVPIVAASAGDAIAIHGQVVGSAAVDARQPPAAAAERCSAVIGVVDGEYE